MPSVTKEQVAAARRMTAIEFLRRYRAGDLVQSSAHGEFELKSHDSFKINGESSLWHWKSRGIGGKSALDYLLHVEGCSFVEAVHLLCDEQPVFTPQNHLEVEHRRPPFELPPKSPTSTRVEAYLLPKRMARRLRLLQEQLPNPRWRIWLQLLYAKKEEYRLPDGKEVL